MISLSREDGARKDILELCTHNPQKKGSSIDVYTTFPWEALCREVAKLVIHRRSPDNLVELRAAVAAAASSSDEPPDDGPFDPDPGVGPQPRVVQDDGRELREARGGGGCAAETGAGGAHRRAAGVVMGGLLNTCGGTSNRSPIVPRTVLSNRTEKIPK